MGIETAEIGGGAYEAALDRACAEASWDWSGTALEQALEWEYDGLNELGVDEHARAVVEGASPYGLVGRLQEVAPPDARLSESRSPGCDRSLESDRSLGSGRSRALTDTLDLLRAADRLASWVAARQAALVAEVFREVHDAGIQCRRVPGSDGPGAEASGMGRADRRFSFMLATQEIAPLLRVPGRTAHRMVGDALRLTEELPATWEALDAGTISAVQAQVIVEESGSIPVEDVPGFEGKVLETAGALTRPKLVRRCRRLREELHPESITVRKERAVRGRDVTVEPEQDGMAWLSAYLPAEQAHGIFNRVDTAARSLQGPGEPRTLAQLRADVFADVLTHTCTGDPKKGTSFRGVRANVFVTVPVMTLLGHRRADWQAMSDDQANDATGNGPVSCAPNSGTRPGLATAPGPLDAAGPDDSGSGDCAPSSGSSAPDLTGCENGLLDGYGPIDPETARNLAAHASSFTRILVHPETGAVLSVGRDRYRPPKHLQDWVRITNPTCVHPGCNRSSWSCEIDHVTPWAHGGETALDNLKPRCKLHHMLKTDGIWATGRNTGEDTGEDTGQHNGQDPGHNNQGAQHVTSLGGKTYTTLPEPPPPF